MSHDGKEGLKVCIVQRMTKNLRPEASGPELDHKPGCLVESGGREKVLTQVRTCQ
jgi:hypothetical protein